MPIKQYIQDIKNLPEPRKTFMEIMKVHQSEVHMANLLAFFFRSEEKHGLRKLFIEALLNTKCYDLDIEKRESIGSFISQVIPNEEKQDEPLNSKQKDFLNSIVDVEVKNEDKTTEDTKKDNKRIDILLKTETSIVCIEFKINHDLNNPLDAYQNHIEEKYSNKKYKFYTVLTPYKKKPSVDVQEFIEKDEKKTNMFSQIILSHFIENVVKNIPKDYFIKNSENSNSLYLIELIQTINNRNIRFKRGEILKDLHSHISHNYKSEYYAKGLKGGFIQLNLINSKYKIRIKDNHQFQVEKWSTDNKLERNYTPFELDNSSGYKTVKTELENIIKTAGNTM